MKIHLILKPRAQLYCVDNIFLHSNIFNHIIRQNIKVRKLLPPPSICKERSLNTLWLQTIGSGKPLQFTSGRNHISNRKSTNTLYSRQCKGHTKQSQKNTSWTLCDVKINCNGWLCSTTVYAKDKFCVIIVSLIVMSNFFHICSIVVA